MREGGVGEGGREGGDSPHNSMVPPLQLSTVVDDKLTKYASKLHPEKETHHIQ